MPPTPMKPRTIFSLAGTAAGSLFFASWPFTWGVSRLSPAFLGDSACATASVEAARNSRRVQSFIMSPGEPDHDRAKNESGGRGSRTHFAFIGMPKSPSMFRQTE